MLSLPIESGKTFLKNCVNFRRMPSKVLGAAFLCAFLGSDASVPLKALHAAEGGQVYHSLDQKFQEELLRRGLFRLAELHCRERLQLDSVSEAGRAELTLELIRVLQEKALCAPLPEKKELDAQALAIYEDFRKAEPECPWLLPIDFQFAVGVFANARRLEMEAKFALDSEKRMEDVREAIREAIRRLEQVDSEREKQILELAQDGGVSKKKSAKSGSSKKNSEEEKDREDFARFSGERLSLWELESLKNHVQFQLLLAYELQAETYPDGSLDRLNALREAHSRARNLTIVPANSSLYWSARIEEIRCSRLQSDFEGAKKRIDSLASQMEVMPEKIRFELLAERIRLFLAKDDLKAALKVAKTELHANILGKNGELDCAILELWLEQWRAAMKDAEKETPETGVQARTEAESGKEFGKELGKESGKENPDVQKFRDEALGILDTIRKKSAPWWCLKAEVLFNGMLKNAGENQNLSFLQLAAENACANFDVDAARACERLWSAAVEQKETKTALHAAQLAAAFLYEKEEKEEAVLWFRRLSVTFPDEADAVKNHLNAIAVMAEVVSAALEKSDGKLSEDLNRKLDAYQALLLEHFQFFGKKNPDALDVLRKLETAARIRGRLAECVDIGMILTANTSADDSDYPKTVSDCFEAWEKYLDLLRKDAPESYVQVLWSAVQWSETLPESQARAMGSYAFLARLDELHDLLEKRQRNRKNQAAEEAIEEAAEEEPGQEEVQEAENAESLEAAEFSESAKREIAENGSAENGEISNGGGSETEAPRSKGPSPEERILERIAEDEEEAFLKRLIQTEIRFFQAIQPHLEAFPQEIRDEIEEIGISALIRTGKGEEAFPFYEKIAQKFPTRLDVQLTWGRLLAENALKTAGIDSADKISGDSGGNSEFGGASTAKAPKTLDDSAVRNLKRAQEQWRKIERHVENLTPEWYEAKYWILRFQIELGDLQYAARVFRTFKILHPDLGGKAWKPRFEHLETQLNEKLPQEKK